MKNTRGEQKNAEISDMSAEVCDLKKKVREMSTEIVNHHQMLNKGEEDEEIIQQANNILEKSKDSEESGDAVCTLKDESNAPYAQILKEKNKIKCRQSTDTRGFENVNIILEVKEVIRKTQYY